jgi:hypothetical protein
VCFRFRTEAFAVPTHLVHACVLGAIAIADTRSHGLDVGTVVAVRRSSNGDGSDVPPHAVASLRSARQVLEGPSSSRPGRLIARTSLGS